MGGIDFLFHVAGGSQHAAAEDTTDEVDRDMFELNVLSAMVGRCRFTLSNQR